MKNINESTFSTVLTVIAVIVAGLGLAAMLKILAKSIRPDLKLNSEFFGELDKKFELGLVSGISDIVILADSFRRERAAFYNLNVLLQDYLRYLINKAYTAEGELKEAFVNRHRLTQQILNIENEEKPYNELPDEEKRIFRAINVGIKSDDRNDALSALEDLRIVISTKNKIYQQSNTINKLSIPLAIVGLVLTIYFGIKSLPTTENRELQNTKTAKAYKGVAGDSLKKIIKR